MASDHDLLIAKLDAFIRKYYKDRLIRGVLYSAGLLVLFFLCASLTEYFGRFGTTVRTVLFWAFIIAALAVVVRFIVLPLMKLLRLGPVIFARRGRPHRGGALRRGEGQAAEHPPAPRTGPWRSRGPRPYRGQHRPAQP
ncbi:MAG: hypothetical protein QM724_03125 [Flavobacteriales bacterium]